MYVLKFVNTTDYLVRLSSLIKTKTGRMKMQAFPQPQLPGNLKKLSHQAFKQTFGWFDNHDKLRQDS